MAEESFENRVSQLMSGLEIDAAEHNWTAIDDALRHKRRRRLAWLWLLPLLLAAVWLGVEMLAHRHEPDVAHSAAPMAQKNIMAPAAQGDPAAQPTGSARKDAEPIAEANPAPSTEAGSNTRPHTPAQNIVALQMPRKGSALSGTAVGRTNVSGVESVAAARKRQRHSNQIAAAHLKTAKPKSEAFGNERPVNNGLNQTDEVAAASTTVEGGIASELPKEPQPETMEPSTLATLKSNLTTELPNTATTTATQPKKSDPVANTNATKSKAAKKTSKWQTVVSIGGALVATVGSNQPVYYLNTSPGSASGIGSTTPMSMSILQLDGEVGFRRANQRLYWQPGIGYRHRFYGGMEPVSEGLINLPLKGGVLIPAVNAAMSVGVQNSLSVIRPASQDALLKTNVYNGNWRFYQPSLSLAAEKAVRVMRQNFFVGLQAEYGLFKYAEGHPLSLGLRLGFLGKK